MKTSLAGGLAHLRSQKLTTDKLLRHKNIFKTVKKLHQMISFTLIHNFTWSQQTKHT